MNSLLYNTESKPLCSVSNYVFDTNDNVLLDMDKHQIAMVGISSLIIVYIYLIYMYF